MIKEDNINIFCSYLNKYEDVFTELMKKALIKKDIENKYDVYYVVSDIEEITIQIKTIEDNYDVLFLRDAALEEIKSNLYSIQIQDRYKYIRDIFKKIRWEYFFNRTDKWLGSIKDEPGMIGSPLIFWEINYYFPSRMLLAGISKRHFSTYNRTEKYLDSVMLQACLFIDDIENLSKDFDINLEKLNNDVGFEFGDFDKVKDENASETEDRMGEVFAHLTSLNDRVLLKELFNNGRIKDNLIDIKNVASFVKDLYPYWNCGVIPKKYSPTLNALIRSNFTRNGNDIPDTTISDAISKAKNAE